MPHGGRRPNSGPKKGAKYRPTITKEQGREATRQLVMASLGPMVRAQIAHAQGIGHLFARDKTGKFTKIENEAEATRLLLEGTEGEHYWIFMKDPSVQAFTDLLNRALDKPKEQEQEIRLTGLDELHERLDRGRQRNANR